MNTRKPPKTKQELKKRNSADSSTVSSNLQMRAFRLQHAVVSFFVNRVMGWSIVVHDSNTASTFLSSRVLFANLNQLGHAGAIGVVLAMPMPVEFIVNLGWKLFPVFGWFSKSRYSEIGGLCVWAFSHVSLTAIVKQIPGHGLKVMEKVAHDFQKGLINAVYMS